MRERALDTIKGSDDYDNDDDNTDDIHDEVHDDINKLSVVALKYYKISNIRNE